MENLLGYYLAKQYLDQKKSKSGVDYIDHIDQGLIILRAANASKEVCEAFCIHPLIQDDESLRNNVIALTGFGSLTIVYAMEYRNIANLGLRRHFEKDPKNIVLSPIEEVNTMLMADKIQNYYSFMKHNYGRHPESDRLETYFNAWFEALSISNYMYLTYTELIEREGKKQC